MGIPLNQVTVAEVNMKGLISSGGSNSVNTQFLFHYRRASTSVDPTKAALDTVFQSDHAAKIILALNEGWSQLTNEVRWVNDALDQAVPFTHVNAGAITGDRLASHNAVFMLFRTGIKGRSYRGGKHFGPFSESDVTAADEDVLNSGAITRVTAIATALAGSLTDSTGNVWALTLFSRVLSVVKPNPTTIVANNVTSILFNKRIANMKRRQVKSVY